MIEDAPDPLPVVAGYEAWAPLYDHDGNPLIPLEGPAVQRLAGAVEGRLALDYGCGTGRHALALAARGARVVGVDGTKGMIRRARRKAPEIAWLLWSFPGRLPFGAERFDLAVMGLVAEHLIELDQALLDLRRVLKPEGRLILSSLHPDRLLEGQQARFIDPLTGQRRPIATVPRSVSDYLKAGSAAGLELEIEESLIAGPDLAARFPRAERYVGRPLGWVARWARP